MKTNDSFEAWYKERSLSQKRLISKIRRIVASTEPKLIESSKWTNGVWLKGDLPIIYCHTEPDHIQFGFLAGASLSDPKGLLVGNGKQVRHIRIESSKDINEKAFATMVRKAYKAPHYKRKSQSL